MTECIHCGRLVPDGFARIDDDRRPQDDADELRDLARVRDLAEAGYLVDLLEGHGIRARIRHAQHFDSLTGAWALTHFLQCAPEDAEAAAAAIAAEARDADEEDRNLASQSPTPYAAGWKSVALALAAGWTCFMLGQRVGEHSAPAGAASRASRLSHALAVIDRPFYTAPDERGQTFRLGPHGRAGQWRVDADRDGDGRYETRLAEDRLPTPNR